MGAPAVQDQSLVGMSPSLCAMHAASLYRSGRHRTRHAAAASAGVAASTVSSAVRLMTEAAPELVAALWNGLLTVDAAWKLHRRTPQHVKQIACVERLKVARTPAARSEALGAIPAGRRQSPILRPPARIVRKLLDQLEHHVAVLEDEAAAPFTPADREAFIARAGRLSGQLRHFTNTLRKGDPHGSTSQNGTRDET